MRPLPRSLSTSWISQVRHPAASTRETPREEVTGEITRSSSAHETELNSEPAVTCQWTVDLDRLNLAVVVRRIGWCEGHRRLPGSHRRSAARRARPGLWTKEDSGVRGRVRLGTTAGALP